MLATHWIKTGVFLLYIAILLFVISQCGRLTGTDPPSPTPVTPGPKDKEVAKATAELSVWERAQARERERKAHEAKMAKRRADYEKLEAELAAMIKNDIPAALDELAGAACAYRRKIPDLQHLKKEEQWVREAPLPALVELAAQRLPAQSDPVQVDHARRIRLFAPTRNPPESIRRTPADHDSLIVEGVLSASRAAIADSAGGRERPRRPTRAT